MGQTSITSEQPARASPSAPWTQPQALKALACWLDTHVPALGTGAVRLSALAGGSSGSVLLLERGDSRAVLRTTSWPPRPDSLRALEREARVLEALDRTDVPHPRFLGYCADKAVLGSAFCLVEHIRGWLGSGSAPPPFDTDLSLRHQTAFAMIDALASLASVDYAAIGLTDFGKPEKFLDRQVDRWLKLMAEHRKHPEYGNRRLPGFDETAQWLRAHTPATARIALIHGDLSLSNLMFRNDLPPRAAAIIDWEIATLGDPLLDLGRSLYPFPSRNGQPGYSLAIDLSGYPAREELAQRYAERTGLDVSGINYYMVLAMFKLAALIEFNYVKSLHDPDESSMSRRIARFVPQLVAGAWQLARAARVIHEAN
jgi:aminoglycoside phosphotransferase (APT) family kinase protein